MKKIFMRELGILDQSAILIESVVNSGTRTKTPMVPHRGNIIFGFPSDWPFDPTAGFSDW